MTATPEREDRAVMTRVLDRLTPWAVRGWARHRRHRRAVSEWLTDGYWHSGVLIGLCLFSYCIGLGIGLAVGYGS